METLKSLTDYYGAYDEDGRLASKHGQVEFLTTMRYIHRYLRPGMRVLEIGAGTGRYAHALAREGYAVDAVELVQHNIDIFMRNTQPGEQVSIIQGNALDLTGFEENAYDITLLLGPMYHLYEAADQKRALSEALRVTKHGGVLFAAYCISDASIIQHGFGYGMILDLIEKGLVETESFKAYSTPEEVFQLYRKEDIDSLMSDFDAERLHYVATDLATRYIRDAVNEMTDEVYQIYLQYHFSICERPDMMGLTNHSLDISRKR